MLFYGSWIKTKDIDHQTSVRSFRQRGLSSTPHIWFRPLRFRGHSQKRFHTERSSYAFKWGKYVNRSRLATASILLLYVTTFVGNKYAESGSFLDRNVTHLPGFETRDYEVTHQFRQPKPISASSSRPQDFFSDRMLSYCVKDWPPNFSSMKSCTPYIGYIFAHENIVDLAVSGYVTWVLAPQLMTHFGITKILFAFVASGFTASQLHSSIDKSYAMRSTSPLFKYIKATTTDPDPNRTLSTRNKGAHYSNAALFALYIFNSSRGGSRMGFFRSPPGLFTICLVGLDAWAYYENYITPKSGGYLAVFISGGIIYCGWLRWTKGPKMLRSFL